MLLAVEVRMQLYNVHVHKHDLNITRLGCTEQAVMSSRLIVPDTDSYIRG
jgi:hypothetical protein